MFMARMVEVSKQKKKVPFNFVIFSDILSDAISIFSEALHIILYCTVWYIFLRG